MVNLALDENVLPQELEDERFDDTDETSERDASEREFRDASMQIVVQRNDFFLPNLIDMVRTHDAREPIRRSRYPHITSEGLGGISTGNLG